MKLAGLARALLRFLIALAALSAFVVLDWYPTVKELGRLRRERNDMERKISNYDAIAAGFAFPDAGERALLARSENSLLQSLPQVERDDAWEATVLAELRVQAGEDGIAGARILIIPLAPEAGLRAARPGRAEFPADWVFHTQAPALADALAIAADPGRFPWHGILTGLEFGRGQRLANRPLAIILEAPLPALLNFVNHVSWGDARLEIARLHLEPGASLPRAWLVCRGHYLVRAPSVWEVAERAGSGDGLLVDADSPLLWQRVDQEIARQADKKELPPLARR